MKCFLAHTYTHTCADSVVADDADDDDDDAADADDDVDIADTQTQSQTDTHARTTHPTKTTHTFSNFRQK